MIVVVADTHAVIWYLSADAKLTATAKGFIENAAASGNTIGISAITLIEMAYLVEKGRIPAGRFTQVATELLSGSSVFQEIPIELNIARALTQVNSSLVPDMPDRIIAATARRLNVPIISKDKKIELSGLTTIW